MNRKIIKPFIFIIVVAVASLVVMLLWNSIIPSIIGWSAITYFQSLGLLLLCRILFGRITPGFMFHGRDLKEQLRGMSTQDRKEYIREYMSRGIDGK